MNINVVKRDYIFWQQPEVILDSWLEFLGLAK
jgi:hypothetical protein